VRVSVIKHAHHSFDIDHPGKDSYRLRQAGAAQMMLGSAKRWALMTEHPPDQGEPQLEALLQHMDATLADLILVEGFRHAPIPKIEVFRPATGTPLLAAQDPHVIALATDGWVETALPRLDLNNPQAIARFVLAWLEQQKLLLKPAQPS
jgi:molybdopterin-guanine dinucleotide biosynthesis protein B